MTARVTTHRCRATIHPKSLQWRSRDNPCGDELRCCRRMKRLYNGKCWHHSTAEDRDYQRFHERRLIHRQIVRRILDIPPRP